MYVILITSLLPEPAKVMFWSACIYLLVCLYACVYVCMLPTFLKNYRTELHEILRDDLSLSRTNRLDFGNDQVKGQGPGHEKVKNEFLS